ncbi:MAG: S-layer homology domain-containing protein [Desulfovibrionaceae bacterium]
MSDSRMGRVVVLVLAAALAVLAVGCSGKAPRTPVGVLDTPEHHCRTGNDFLDAAAYGPALRAFDTALELRPDYAPALAGRAVVAAGNGSADMAVALLDTALDNADDDRELLLVATAGLRMHALLARAGAEDEATMLSLSGDLYDESLDILEDDAAHALRRDEPALYYYRAESLLAVYRFQDAADLYARIVALREGMEDKADARWRFVQDVMRAAPRTVVGKHIALVDALSRADLAALLREELGADRFFARTRDTQGNAFGPPRTPGSVTSPLMPRDLEGHPLAADVAQVLDYGLRGLMVYPDGMFRPDEPVSRAELAMVLEDVAAQAGRDDGLRTRFIGRASPYADVRADHAAFNAVMFCTTGGLMRVGAVDGLFRPLAPVSGVDAVLAVQGLRSQLQVF